MAKSADYYAGQTLLLAQLMEIARKTQGAEVWRVLFSEALRNIRKERDCGKEPSERTEERLDNARPAF